MAPCGRWPPDTGILTPRIVNTANTVVGTLQKWPAKAGGRSPKGPAVAGTTVQAYKVAFSDRHFEVGRNCLRRHLLTVLVCMCR